jgi:hypothetical protein
MAHFLGANGAAKLIDAAASRPDASAAKLFPRAAAANRSIFYDEQGGARSVTGVYALLATKLAHAMPGAPAPLAAAPPASEIAAAAPGLLSPSRTAAVAPAVPMPPLAKSVAPLMFAQAQAAPAPVDTGPPLAFASEGRSGFYDLFRTEGRGGVSQTVSELWGARAASAPQQTAPTAPVVPASAADEGFRGGFDFFRTPRT